MKTLAIIYTVLLFLAIAFFLKAYYNETKKGMEIKRRTRREIQLRNKRNKYLHDRYISGKK